MEYGLYARHSYLRKKLRVLNIIDDYKREAIAVQVAYSHSGTTVKQTLQNVFKERSKPKEIRCDNGSEFISHALSEYCKTENITLKHIQPGKPTQNANRKI